MAKSKLAPISTTTIPRLELCAAVAAVKLGVLVKKELKIEVESYYWTDSMIVLQYIRNKKKRFKTFVANRVEKIISNSSVSQWKHVPGKYNPADISSRGMKAGELIESDLWLNGPEFLKEDKTQ